METKDFTKLVATPIVTVMDCDWKYYLQKVSCEYVLKNKGGQQQTQIYLQNPATHTKKTAKKPKPNKSQQQPTLSNNTTPKKNPTNKLCYKPKPKSGW